MRKPEDFKNEHEDRGHGDGEPGGDGEGGHGEGGHGNDRDRFDAVTRLYIRTHPSDDGNVPLPAGWPFWISPDITVQPPMGSEGDQAKANVENTLRITVTNGGGITAHNAYVDAFSADPSTAFTPATAIPIGATTATMAGYNTTTVQLPWTPTTSEGGHRCLLARVNHPLTGDGIASPGIFDVVGDRHVAQRNIHVLTASEAKMGFAFLITNPLKERARFRVRAMAARPTPQLLMAVKGAMCGFAQLGTAPPRVTMRAGERGQAFGMRDQIQLGRLDADLKSLSQFRVAPSAGHIVSPEEAVPAAISLALPAGARPGDVHLSEIVQTDARTGRIIGGLWVAVVG